MIAFSIVLAAGVAALLAVRAMDIEGSQSITPTMHAAE